MVSRKRSLRLELVAPSLLLLLLVPFAESFELHFGLLEFVRVASLAAGLSAIATRSSAVGGVLGGDK